MKRLCSLVLLPVLLSMAVSARAESAVSASLTFSVLAGSGFSWADPAFGNFGASDTSAASFAGWTFSAGLASPNFAPSQIASVTTSALGISSSSGNSASGSTSATAVTVSQPGAFSAALLTSALVPVAGQASATAFTRAYFTLAPGAAVTFTGGLFLAASGDRSAFPANYNLSDFYGYATGSLQVRGDLQTDEVSAEIGGPAPSGTSGVGGYSVTSFKPMLLTVLNSGPSAVTSYLDSGISVYTASPVPEVSTTWMALAGFAVLAGVAIRKRQRQPQAAC